MAAHHRRNVPTETALHPVVYKALASCVAWIVGATFLFFGRDSYAALQLAIVAFFCAAFLLVPFILWAIWRRDNPQQTAPDFKTWASHELQTASGPVEGREAAIMILLAPMSVTMGITLTSLIAFLAS